MPLLSAWISSPSDDGDTIDAHLGHNGDDSAPHPLYKGCSVREVKEHRELVLALQDRNAKEAERQAPARKRKRE